MRGVILEAESDVMPNPDSSVEHPAVTFCTTAAIVVLLHAGPPQRLVSQESMGGITAVVDPPLTSVIKDPRLKHDAASGLVATAVKAAVHWVESLRANGQTLSTTAQEGGTTADIRLGSCRGSQRGNSNNTCAMHYEVVKFCWKWVERGEEKEKMAMLWLLCRHMHIYSERCAAADMPTPQSPVIVVRSPPWTLPRKSLEAHSVGACLSSLDGAYFNGQLLPLCWVWVWRSLNILLNVCYWRFVIYFLGLTEVGCDRW